MGAHHSELVILPEDISVIVPVKNNQGGIDRLLQSVLDRARMNVLPGEIIIIDNNSTERVYLHEDYKDSELNIKLLSCQKPGPAAARNLGVQSASGKWLLFIDSDCLFTESTLTGYQNPSGFIAFQGVISGLGNDYLSRYYSSQQIHLPPCVSPEERGVPKYLVTANALVLKTAFERVGGFNESFKLAGGEDIDLALRLSKIGNLSFAPYSIVRHTFDDGLRGFASRFIRYGKGIRQVKQYHNTYQFPRPFTAANKKALINNILAPLQWIFMAIGYLTMSNMLKKNGSR